MTMAASVAHAAEIPYVYGQIPTVDTAGFGLSTIMMDYWISFTVSLDPNDGKGTDSRYLDLTLYPLTYSRSSILGPRWPQYTAENQVCMQAGW